MTPATAKPFSALIAEDVMSRTVDTHIAMLRRKLETDAAHPRHIVTVRTFGYRIER